MGCPYTVNNYNFCFKTFDHSTTRTMSYVHRASKSCMAITPSKLNIYYDCLNFATNWKWNPMELAYLITYLSCMETMDFTY